MYAYIFYNNYTIYMCNNNIILATYVCKYVFLLLQN